MFFQWALSPRLIVHWVLLSPGGAGGGQGGEQVEENKGWLLRSAPGGVRLPQAAPQWSTAPGILRPWETALKVIQSHPQCVEPASTNQSQCVERTSTYLWCNARKWIAWRGLQAYMQPAATESDRTKVSPDCLILPSPRQLHNQPLSKHSPSWVHPHSFSFEFQQICFFCALPQK